ncbi:MAG: OadG family protein [Saccharofermentans sp.]|nr:OadG family protein [Saccharofermentans sp.]
MTSALLVAKEGVLPMNEALLDAGIVITVVFAVLCIICILITISGKIFSSLVKDEKKPAPAVAATPAAPAEPVKEEEFSSGSLRLKGCDEKTAAMIMAIVSDNTGIPLSELIFKSITLIEEK